MQKGRYAATVEVPFFLGPVVSSHLLREKLQGKGFTNVQVAEEKPLAFPLASVGDYYVSVDWTKSPQAFDVPSAVVEYRKVA